MSKAARGIAAANAGPSKSRKTQQPNLFVGENPPEEPSPADTKTVEPASIPAPAPAAAPADVAVPAPAHRRFTKPHAVDSVLQFGSQIAIRMWSVDATDFLRIVLRTNGVMSTSSSVSTLFYERADLKKIPGVTILGVTIVLSDPILLEAKSAEVVLITRTEEMLVINKVVEKAGYSTFINSLLYDMQRTGRPIEQRLLFDRTRSLPRMIQSGWLEYLAQAKGEYISFGKAYRPASHSIITVFYRRAFLAGLYAFTTSLLDMSPDAEIILCFQEAPEFQQQIDYLEGLFRLFEINHKFILFENNIGFAAANNVAVEHSASPRLMLLNPDICCASPDVYEKIAKASDDGNLYGATLLSDADEVMHNGIEFLEQTVAYRSKAQRVLRTSHIGRHSPVSLIEEDSISDAEAVSGALLAVSRTTWDALGGLPEKFVFAHFEDVEFCRRAAEANVGIKVYNTRQIVHLESYGSGEDSILNAIKQVNSALFNMEPL